MTRAVVGVLLALAVVATGGSALWAAAPAPTALGIEQQLHSGGVAFGTDATGAVILDPATGAPAPGEIVDEGTTEPGELTAAIGRADLFSVEVRVFTNAKARRNAVQREARNVARFGGNSPGVLNPTTDLDCGSRLLVDLQADTRPHLTTLARQVVGILGVQYGRCQARKVA